MKSTFHQKCTLIPVLV
ncbi:hypothetical protein Gorai_013429 [Gossypium raimondii]|uniref:Uncharacterized protein n=2 Tax=Gossypium TaxID=3633 RepID=A0A7J8Q525_GOSRA|nr:hypothetical protein [Gossypium raimondii]MBA0660509.1 hypothetical protein [Gossypium klotzschianum]